MAMKETLVSRVTRSKEQAKASYDRMSRWYDILASSSERKFRDAGLQRLNVKEGEVVLEIGFGTGHSILSLAGAVGDSGKVYGIDISPGMRAVTKQRVFQAGLTDRVALRLGDAAQLPFEEQYFDAVYSSFTLELFDTPEIPIVLQECRRVLRNGGRICVVSMAKKEADSVAVRIYEWFHEKLPAYVDCRPIFVQKSLADAGFQILDVTEMPYWGLPVQIVLGISPPDRR